VHPSQIQQSLGVDVEVDCVVVTVVDGISVVVGEEVVGYGVYVVVGVGVVGEGVYVVVEEDVVVGDGAGVVVGDGVGVVVGDGVGVVGGDGVGDAVGDDVGDEVGEDVGVGRGVSWHKPGGAVSSFSHTSVNGLKMRLMGLQ